MNIAVIYLYYIPYKLVVLQTFIRSLQQNDSGLPFRLYIIFKDAADDESVQLAKDWIHSQNVNFTELHFSGGVDIDAYHYGANSISESHLLFFNSNSNILHPNWLVHYANAKAPGVGVVGATGSWQSYYDVIRRKAIQEMLKPVPFITKFVMLKLLLKSLLQYRVWFHKFPNPHLRTNAFFIEKELFLRLKIKLPIQNKIDAYRFESGKQSFTKQLINLGYQVCIVDNAGHCYFSQDWDKSNIFWQQNQTNLLVSDNQTLTYTKADDDVRIQLSKIAWGHCR